MTLTLAQLAGRNTATKDESTVPVGWQVAYVLDFGRDRYQDSQPLH